jgi:hypothetical protein
MKQQRDFEQEGRDGASGRNTGGYPAGGGYAAAASSAAGVHNSTDRETYERAYQEEQNRKKKN